MTKLKREQRIQLHKALIAAFPGWDELKAMIGLQLDRNIETITPQAVLGTAALNLIVWAEANGYLAELVAGALAQNPDNPDLKAFAASVRASATDTAPAPAVPDAQAEKRRYERLIWKAVEFAGTAAFRAAMIQREAPVCRIEFPEGTGQGTGFLVSPDMLFTNCHVLESYIAGKAIDEVACRFDLQANATGTQISDGRVVKLANQNWLVRSSKVEDLDYALVRLAEKAGHDPVAAGGTRGWLSPETYDFEVGESVFILQHPKAAPLKIASGGVAKVQTDVVHYLANTLRGSSGSPCFTSDWKLAALHQGGDDLANTGIPFKAILADLHSDPTFKFE